MEAVIERLQQDKGVKEHIEKRVSVTPFIDPEKFKQSYMFQDPKKEEVV